MPVFKSGFIFHEVSLLASAVKNWIPASDVPFSATGRYIQLQLSLDYRRLSCSQGTVAVKIEPIAFTDALSNSDIAYRLDAIRELVRNNQDNPEIASRYREDMLQMGFAKIRQADLMGLSFEARWPNGGSRGVTDSCFKAKLLNVSVEKPCNLVLLSRAEAWNGLSSFSFHGSNNDNATVD